MRAPPVGPASRLPLLRFSHSRSRRRRLQVRLVDSSAGCHSPVERAASVARAETVSSAKIAREVARVGPSDAGANLCDTQRSALEQCASTLETQIAQVVDGRAAHLAAKQMGEPGRGESYGFRQPVDVQMVPHVVAHVMKSLFDSPVHVLRVAAFKSRACVA